MNIPPLRLTLAMADAANDAWNFNCGPGALCGLLGKTPEEIRPHLGAFEEKGYTNPTMMQGFLRSLGVLYRQTYQSDLPSAYGDESKSFPEFGLVRIQWDGPWTLPEVPMRARYRYTHWIAARTIEPGEAFRGKMVFDVNFADHGWLNYHTWAKDCVPLIVENIPRTNGLFWPANCYEVERPRPCPR